MLIYETLSKINSTTDLMNNFQKFFQTDILEDATCRFDTCFNGRLGQLANLNFKLRQLNKMIPSLLAAWEISPVYTSTGIIWTLSGI